MIVWRNFMVLKCWVFQFGPKEVVDWPTDQHCLALSQPHTFFYFFSRLYWFKTSLILGPQGGDTARQLFSPTQTSTYHNNYLDITPDLLMRNIRTFFCLCHSQAKISDLLKWTGQIAMEFWEPCDAPRGWTLPIWTVDFLLFPSSCQNIDFAQDIPQNVVQTALKCVESVQAEGAAVLDFIKPKLFYFSHEPRGQG